MKTPEKCHACGELGILRVEDKEQKLESLVTCDCGWANESSVKVWHLPRVTPKIRSAFQVTRCPLTWFLPDNERESVPRGFLSPSMQRVTDAWVNRIRSAQTFWEQWGQIFDQPKPRMPYKDGPEW